MPEDSCNVILLFLESAQTLFGSFAPNYQLSSIHSESFVSKSDTLFESFLRNSDLPELLAFYIMSRCEATHINFRAKTLFGIFNNLNLYLPETTFPIKSWH